jgi:hypothetical protein
MMAEAPLNPVAAGDDRRASISAALAEEVLEGPGEAAHLDAPNEMRRLVLESVATE